MPVETYGLEKLYPEAEKASQVEIEMLAFQLGGTESVTKGQHARRLIELAYPWIAQNWNDWLDMIVWAWCDSGHREIGATGCAASGKTFGFALMASLEFFCAPAHTAVVLSSATVPSLRSRIWPRVKDFWGKWKDGKRYGHLPYHLVDSQTKIQFLKGDDEHSIQAVAVDSGNVEKAIGKIQGRHPARMVFVVDEGEQTPEAVFVARANLQAGTRFYRFASMSNAVNPFSAYGQFIAPKAGWGSVNIDTDTMWETHTGLCLYFDGLKSPNVRAGKIVVPGLLDQQTVDEIKKYGDTSLQWWMYIRGFPAPSGVTNTILDLSTINTGKAIEKPVWDDDSFTYLGALDPAFRTGGDRCILRFAKIGTMQGAAVLGLEEPIHIKLRQDQDVPENYQIAERVAVELAERKMKPEQFGLDETGATGLAQIIEQRIGRGVRKYNFGAKATDMKLPGESKTGHERCKNLVAELWVGFAGLVRCGMVRGLDPDAAQEFRTRQYRLEGEKYVLESKSEMKKRTGGKSPDIADATAILGQMFRERVGPYGVQMSGESFYDKWLDLAQRHVCYQTYEGR